MARAYKPTARPVQRWTWNNARRSQMTRRADTGAGWWRCHVGPDSIRKSDGRHRRLIPTGLARQIPANHGPARPWLASDNARRTPAGVRPPTCNATPVNAHVSAVKAVGAVGTLPPLIQGGMGVAISDWHLANAVSTAGASAWSRVPRSTRCSPTTPGRRPRRPHAPRPRRLPGAGDRRSNSRPFFVEGGKETARLRDAADAQREGG